ncbi:MAG: endonuclease domain-containing protein [Acidobacteriota bacterium]
MNRTHTKPRLRQRRRKLRRHLTPAEATLWTYLKNSKLGGRKFRRQYSIGSFIVDFYCVEEWLAVELDGEVHRYDKALEYDARRTSYLNSAGVKVIWFENVIVFDDIEFVLGNIEFWFGWKERSTTPSAEAAAGVVDHKS